jgi:hypothetical protein
MVSTEAHSQLSAHISNLPENLRPGYRQTDVIGNDQLIERQFDHAGIVNSMDDGARDTEADDSEMEIAQDQYSQFDMFNPMNTGEIHGRDNWSNAGENRQVDSSDDEVVNMREVVDIFHPSTNDEPSGDEDDGQSEADVGGEDDVDEGDTHGWFPFASKVVSTCRISRRSQLLWAQGG